MVDVGQHPNIELLSYSEVQTVSGVPGKYKVKILKKARFVSEKLCIGCGSCSAKCPSKAPSEFDVGTTMRKAIYIPFPQAVPNTYLIDKEHCNYMLSNGEKCGVCVKFCPVNDCIDLHQQDEEVEVTVGNIIVAVGYKPFDAKRIERYGYGRYPNVLTSLELERITNASGPTEGKVTMRTTDKKGNPVFVKDSPQPESIAVIHCVGSRDENYNAYCSRICCMQSLKLAHLVKEKLPDADVFEYYIDMRAFGKGYEEFYNRIANEGIFVVRGKTATIEEKGNKLHLRTEDILNDALIEQEVDMVVLSVGLEPAVDTRQLAGMLGISQDGSGWFREANLLTEPASTEHPGIHIAGVCEGPKDIPDTVTQAATAAARVLHSIEAHAEVIAG
jgi:heterodisulfide reductase subunit A